MSKFLHIISMATQTIEELEVGDKLPKREGLSPVESLEDAKKDQKKEELEQINLSLDEFADKVSATMIELGKLCSRVEVPIIDSPVIPEKTADIEKLFMELETKTASLNSERKEFEKIIKNASDKIGSGTETDISVFANELKKAREAHVTFVRIEAELEDCANQHNLALEKYRAAKIREAGFSSRQEVTQRQQELLAERDKIDKSMFRLGRFLKKGDADQLWKEHQKLEMVVSSSVSEQSNKYFYSNKDKVNSHIRNIGDDVVTLVASQAKTLIEKSNSEMQTYGEDFSPELGEELSREYNDKVLRQKLEEEIAMTRKKDVDHDWGTEAVREKALKILFKYYGTDFSFNRSYRDSDDVVKEKADLRSIVDFFPYKLKEFLERRLMITRRYDDWEKTFEAVGKNVPINRFVNKLSKSFGDAKKSINDEGGSNFHAVVAGISSEKQKIEDKYSKPALDKFSTERWNVFRSNKIVQSTFSGKQLNAYEVSIANDLGEELKGARAPEETYMYARKLFELQSKDIAPILTLTAFRLCKDGGRSQFLYNAGDYGTRDSALCKYFESFSKDDLDKLRAINPETVEIIEEVLKNKDNFNDSDITTKDANEAEESRKPNPTFLYIQSKLAELSCRILDEGTETEKMFVINTIKRLRNEPLGIQADALRKMMEDPKDNYWVTEKAQDVFFDRFINSGELESLRIVLNNSTLSYPYQEKILDILTSHWDLVSHFGELLTKADLDLLSSKMVVFLKAKAEDANQRTRIKAFVLAEHLGIDLKPTAKDFVEMYDVFYDLPSEIRNKLYSMGMNLDLTEEQGSHVANYMYHRAIFMERDLFINQEAVAQAKKIVDKFIVGKMFTEEDKEALLWSMSGKNKAELIDTSQGKCTRENWSTLLSYYVYLSGEQFHPETNEAKVKLANMFSNLHPENRDFCLSELQNMWQEYLASSEGAQFPVRAKVLMDARERVEGVGDLKHIDGMIGIMNNVNKLDKLPKTSKRTKEGVHEGLNSQEQRFKDERWSDDDKTAFYNISSSVLEVAPSLYTDFLDVFEVMNSKSMKEFARRQLPLYQANLVVLQNQDGKYNARELVQLRKNLEGLKSELVAAKTPKNSQDQDVAKIFASQEKNLVSMLENKVERRFGLIKIPEVITDEHIRNMRDMTIFIANINGRNETKELTIGLYLGLILNNEWDKFRAGQDIDLSLYFDEHNVRKLSEIIKEKKLLSEGTFSNLGLDEKTTATFKEKLQEETVSQSVGSIQTIDIKLGNTKRNLEDLADPDIYTDDAEKKIVGLLKEKGKLIGGVLAKTYSQASGKSMKMSEEELSLQEKLKEIYDIKEWTPSRVKELQDKVQLPSLILNMLKKLEDEEIDENINKLQELLNPSPEIIEIMNAFGEDFKPSSGAMALSQDLTYLENIIVKNENKIGADQRLVLKKYLESINAQMVVLENIYTKTKEYFDKIKKGSHATTNVVLKSRLSEIESILNQTGDATPITTLVTSNMAVVIENMRQCLGCLRKEVNNDTNLTFGDANKFYMVSLGEKSTGSIADQLVYVLPVETAEYGKEMSFVVDKLYGAKTADVLLSHTKALLKKYVALKKEFPEAKLSVFVSSAALSTAGSNIESYVGMVTKDMADSLGKSIHFNEVGSAKVDVPKSALGANYIEFGGESARKEGEREVSGLRLTVD